MVSFQTPEEYFNKTETAVRILLNGIEEYRNILRPMREAVFVTGETDSCRRMAAHLKWREDNKDLVERANAAKQEFYAQEFAMSVLCGSLLHVAEKAIRIYSREKPITENLDHIFNDKKIEDKVCKFCVGRKIREVPVGLIVYAGRNQHMHCDEDKLKNIVNVCVFEQLTTLSEYPEFRDPAFDLAARHLDSYASNVTALLGWRTYDAYIEDMRMMLVAI